MKPLKLVSKITAIFLCLALSLAVARGGDTISRNQFLVALVMPRTSPTLALRPTTENNTPAKIAAGLEGVKFQSARNLEQDPIIARIGRILEGTDPLTDFVGAKESWTLSHLLADLRAARVSSKPLPPGFIARQAERIRSVLRVPQDRLDRYERGERSLDTLRLLERRIVHRSVGGSPGTHFPTVSRSQLKEFADFHCNVPSGRLSADSKAKLAEMLKKRSDRGLASRLHAVPEPGRLKAAFRELELTIRRENLIPKQARPVKKKPAPKSTQVTPPAMVDRLRRDWIGASQKAVDRLIEAAPQSEQQPIGFGTSIELEDRAKGFSVDHLAGRAGLPQPNLGLLKQRLSSGEAAIEIDYAGSKTLIRVLNTIINKPAAIQPRIDLLNGFPTSAQAKQLFKDPTAGLEAGDKGLFLTQIRPEDRSVAPFSTEETEQVLGRLQTMRPEARNQPLLDGGTLQLLHRLARTVPQQDRKLNARIEQELLRWIQEVADHRAVAAVVAGWSSPSYPSAASPPTQNPISRSSPRQILFPILQGRGLPLDQSAKLAQISREPAYQHMEVSVEGLPADYKDQLLDRSIYGKLGRDRLNLYAERLETIRVLELKEWLQQQMGRVTGTRGQILSVALYGGYLYGFREEPLDIDLLAIVDAPLSAPIKQPMEIPSRVFDSKYARRIQTADVTFVTPQQLENSARIALMMASVGIALRGEGLLDLKLQGEVGINRLACAGQLIHEGRRKAKQKIRTTERFEDAAPVWIGKAMRRALEANILISKIDPSVAIAQSVIEGFEDRVREFLAGVLPPEQIRQELLGLYDRLEVALLQARAAVIWHEIEKVTPTDPSRWAGPQYLQIISDLEQLKLEFERAIQAQSSDDFDRNFWLVFPTGINSAIEQIKRGDPASAVEALIATLTLSASEVGDPFESFDAFNRIRQLAAAVTALPRDFPAHPDRHGQFRQVAEITDAAQAVSRRLALQAQAYATSRQQELSAVTADLLGTLRDSGWLVNSLSLQVLFPLIEQIRLGAIDPRRYAEEAWLPVALIEADLAKWGDEDRWKRAAAYWGLGTLLNALDPSAIAELESRLASASLSVDAGDPLIVVDLHDQPRASTLLSHAPEHYFNLAQQTMDLAAGLEGQAEPVMQPPDWKTMTVKEYFRWLLKTYARSAKVEEVQFFALEIAGLKEGIEVLEIPVDKLLSRDQRELGLSRLLRTLRQQEGIESASLAKDRIRPVESRRYSDDRGSWRRIVVQVVPAAGLEGVQIMPLATLQEKAATHPKLRRVVKDLEAKGRAGLLLVEDTAWVKAALVKESPRTTYLFAHDSVRGFVFDFLKRSGFVSMHRTVDVTRLPPQTRLANRLIRHAAELSKDEKSLVVAAVDHQYYRALWYPTDSFAPVLIVDPRTWLFQVDQDLLQAALVHARKFPGLLLDLTIGPPRQVTIDGTKYYALDIAA